ncbi:hypothetical protein COB55_02700 [Candidatus Wolfebacteria bacterium]|nr:MAG: hypothetical protein COB55_02700 [Candidatus Wolfebacteria bacterium]
MNSLGKSLGKALDHHAYSLAGNIDVCVSDVTSWCDKHGDIKTVGNPDFWKGRFDTFGIDDSRSLNELQTRKSIGDKKIFVLAFNFITREAQNALLKMLEEPTSGTHFFVITPSIDALLPTVRSRLIHLETDSVTSKFSDIDLFIKGTMAYRMNTVSDIVADVKTDEGSKQSAIDFLGSLERSWYTNGYPKEHLGPLLTAKQYLYDRSSSVKTILEHIAVTLPLVN